MSTIKIYTDGACAMQTVSRPGGWGCYIVKNNKSYRLSGAELMTTNQRMEIKACSEGLTAICDLFEEIDKVEIYSDSAYVCNCFNQNWWRNWEKNGWVNSKKEPVANRELWEELIKGYKNFDVEFIKITGHSGNEGNEIANTLAQNESNALKKSIM